MHHHAAWALVALLVCLPARAVDSKPPPVAPAARAVSVEPLGLTSRFALDRITTTLLPGDEIGHSSHGAFCTDRQRVLTNERFLKNTGATETELTTQLLRRYGFPMATPGAGAAYAADLSAAPDFRIGGIIREIRFDVCRNGNEASGWYYIKIDWALFSERAQKVVHQMTVEGLATSDRKTPELARRAVTSAFDGFVGSRGFLEAVQPGSAAQLAALPESARAVPAPKTSSLRRDNPPAVAALTPLRADAEKLQVRLAIDPPSVALLAGDEIGVATHGSLCNAPEPITASENFLRTYGQFIATVVQQSLRRQGYPLASQARRSAFDTEMQDPPDFRIGGALRELQVVVCNSAGESDGWVRARIDWSLYSHKARRVVLRRSTEGLFVSPRRIPDLPARAVAVAVDNLLADPAFLAALKADAAADGEAARAATLQLAGGTVAPGGAARNQARLRAAVATLETTRGKGSGFYIDREGHLLTNFHVVNGSRFVKVTLPGAEPLVAEVLRVSEHDDVALLKTAPVDLEPLALRPDALPVGEDVYAIGTPLGVLDSTMTRGVLSADRVMLGYRVLQSDAAVTFGSSGGPLLDADGRVVGITMSVAPGEKAFNFFIPVQDALRALDVAAGAR